MNIGIVLGVSEYLDANNNLPGCQKDADIIKSILDKTSKYDDILYINEKLTSAQVKEKLTDFISNHKQSEIEEFIFYYTGHGEFHNDEFYFHLSDFTEEKRNQTSLQNGEIDNLIKTLKPILVVKIIDACQSGKSYIKEANVINKYFKKTQIGFDKCYFLNSSLNDQYSYQSDLISDFTQSFINAVKEHKTSEIRYKDIIDYISDEFERNSSQTPFFVIQADYTEIFCQIDKSLRAYLDSLIFKQKSVSEMQSEGSSLLEKIKEQAKNFSSKDEALQLVNDLQAEVQKFECNEQLKEIFDLNIAFHENYNHVVKETVIGKWLDDNDHEYFASSKSSRLRKDRYTDPFAAFKSSILIGQQNDDEYEWVMTGFDLDVEVPYKTIMLNLDSKFPNVDSFTCRIVILISKRQIGFFYFITNFVENNWDERKLNSNIEWFLAEYPITNKEEVVEGIKKIFNALEDRANKYLKENFEKQE